jgi:hypothetical protein
MLASLLPSALADLIFFSDFIFNLSSFLAISLMSLGLHLPELLSDPLKRAASFLRGDWLWRRWQRFILALATVAAAR